MKVNWKTKFHFCKSKFEACNTNFRQTARISQKLNSTLQNHGYMDINFANRVHKERGRKEISKLQN